MSKVVSDLPIEAGLFTEQSARGAKGRWKDADKVRFRYGLPEKIGGWEQLQPQFLGLARRIHDWASLDGRLWTAIGTDKKLYLWQDETLFDITPLRLEIVLTNPFSTTAGSTTVVVAHTGGHGAQSGDYVTFEGADVIDGIDLNGEFEITRIVSFEEYEIEAPVAGTAGVLGGGGTVTAKYDISVGGADSAVGYGWGVGGWSEAGVGAIGSSGWSTPRQRSSQLIPARTWSLDNWGEDLIANPNGKSIYWWDRTLGPETRAVLLAGAPSRCNVSIISQRDRQLFALGCTDYVGGQFDPLLIRYCSRENFNDWIPSDTNTAGDLRLFRGSKIITGIRTRAELLVFTDVSVHSVNYLGEGLLYGINVVGENVSIMGPNAAVAVDHRVMFMAEADFYLYDGVLRVLPCPVRNYVFGHLDKTQKVKVHAGLNREFNEVWWFYPVAAEAPPEPPPFEFAADSPVVIESGIDDTQYPNTNVVINDIAYGDGVYVAVASQGKYCYSTDGGDTWQEGVQLDTTPYEISGVAYGNGRFIAIGQTGITRISLDGINWFNGPTVPNMSFGTVNFNEGEFIAGGVSSSGQIFRSTDGSSWEASTMPQAFSVAWPHKVNGRYVAINGGDIYWSDDFSVWTLGLSVSSVSYLTWDAALELFIANVSGNTYTSADNAESWQQVTSAPGNVVASGTGFYISRATSFLYYSTDLTVWNQFNGTYGILTAARFLNGDFWAVGQEEMLVRVTEGVVPEPVVIPASEITNYVCLNIEEGTWTYGTMPRTAWTDASPVLEKPYAASVDGYLYQHETGVDENGSAMTAFIESYDMEIPQSGEHFTHIDQLIPDFLTLEGSVDLTLKGKKYPHQPDYQVKGPYLVDPTIQKVSTRIRARQVALRIESGDVGDKWRLATIRGRLRAHGKRA